MFTVPTSNPKAAHLEGPARFTQCTNALTPEQNKAASLFCRTVAPIMAKWALFFGEDIKPYQYDTTSKPKSFNALNAAKEAMIVAQNIYLSKSAVETAIQAGDIDARLATQGERTKVELSFIDEVGESKAAIKRWYNENPGYAGAKKRIDAFLIDAKCISSRYTLVHVRGGLLRTIAIAGDKEEAAKVLAIRPSVFLSDDNNTRTLCAKKAYVKPNNSDLLGTIGFIIANPYHRDSWPNKV